MRGVVLGLALLGLAGPARADDFGAAAAAKRAAREQRRGIILGGAGGAFGVITVAGLAVLVSASACPGEFDSLFCAIARIDTGTIMASAAGLVAIPLVTAGVTLFRVGRHDAVGEPPPNRRIRGRGIAIVGGAMTAAAIVLGSLALWYGYDKKPYDQDAWAATTSLAIIHGAV